MIGPAIVRRAFALNEIPLYVKAGSIVPMQPEMKNSHAKPVDPLILNVFPGDSGLTRIYEDSGNSLGYKHGEYAQTTVRKSTVDVGRQQIEVLPVSGKYPGMLLQRSHEIRLVMSWPPDSVLCNGKVIPYLLDGTTNCWNYDGDKLTAIIHLPESDVHRKLDVRVSFPSGTKADDLMLDGVPGKLSKLRRVMPLLNGTWPDEWSTGVLVNAVQTGNRIGLDPKRARAELQSLNHKIDEVARQIDTLRVSAQLIRKVHARLR